MYGDMDVLLSLYCSVAIGVVISFVLMITIMAWHLFYRYIVASVITHEDGYVYAKIRIRKEK
jgi:hypothetical protein